MPFSEQDRQVRIFFSVDVVGSTAYKTKAAKYDPLDWSRFYDTFFDDFRTEFAGHLDKISETHTAPSHAPMLWKLLGDEILYTALIENEHDAYLLTKAFYRAVFGYDKALSDQNQLRVKGAGWIAGFPIRNFVIQPRPISDQEATVSDYIGLDIDIGFRLSHTAPAGRMVVAMDLIELLARDPDYKDNLRYFHVGWDTFKGVFDNQPYPIFWILEGEEQPKQLPWQEHICPFTKTFMKEKEAGRKADTTSHILRLNSDIRLALPDLQLFPPYFRPEDMPDFHRKIWEKGKREEQSEEAINVLKGDSPLGEDLEGQQ